MANHFKGLLHLSYFTTFAYEFSQIKTTEFVITLKRPLVNARSGDDNVIQWRVNLYFDLQSGVRLSSGHLVRITTTIGKTRPTLDDKVIYRGSHLIRSWTPVRCSKMNFECSQTQKWFIPDRRIIRATGMIGMKLPKWNSDAAIGIFKNEMISWKTDFLFVQKDMEPILELDSK